MKQFCPGIPWNFLEFHLPKSVWLKYLRKRYIGLFIDLYIFRQTAHAVGVSNIYDRVLSELVNKMKEMKMDKTELGCLRAIILYNPGIKL